MAGLSSSSTTSTPPSSRRSRRREGPAVHFVERGRVWSVVSLLVVLFLLVLALGGSWWEATVNSVDPTSSTTIQGVTVNFELGGGVRCSSYGWVAGSDPCQNISSSQPGARGLAYSAFEDAVVAILAASAVAWVLAALGLFGIRRGRWQLRLEIALVFVVAFAALAIVGGSVALGPGPQGSGYCTYLSGNVTGCSAFFGSSPAGFLPGGCVTCDNVLSWGGGGAFYETLGAMAVAAGTAGTLWISRSKPYTAEEVAEWAKRYAPASPTRAPATAPAPAAVVGPAMAGTGVGAAPGESPAIPDYIGTRPPISAVRPSFQVAQSDWTCPRCGRDNSRWSVVCGGCGSDRPES